MLYPKGEFDNLTLWHVIPILLTVIVIEIVSGQPGLSKNADDYRCEANCGEQHKIG